MINVKTFKVLTLKGHILFFQNHEIMLKRQFCVIKNKDRSCQKHSTFEFMSHVELMSLEDFYKSYMDNCC